MSYRVSTLKEHQFESRIGGYAFGEDRDFGFRVSHGSKLAVEPRARCLHHSARENRLNHRRLGTEATVMTYVWVREQRSKGLSRIAFFWSAVGDLLRHGFVAVTGNGPDAEDSRAHARGIYDGLKIILMGNASRHAWGTAGPS